MISAVFNGFMLIGFQLIFSLVLKGKTRNLGEGTELPLIGEINLAKMLGIDAEAPIGLNDVMIAFCFIPLLIFLRGFFGYLSSYLQAWVTNKVAYQLRDDAFHCVMRQSRLFLITPKQVS
jgi:subfamily B ATP-binding cassette protein MsbA